MIAFNSPSYSANCYARTSFYAIFAFLLPSTNQIFLIEADPTHDGVCISWFPHFDSKSINFFVDIISQIAFRVPSVTKKSAHKQCFSVVSFSSPPCVCSPPSLAYHISNTLSAADDRPCVDAQNERQTRNEMIVSSIGGTANPSLAEGSCKYREMCSRIMMLQSWMTSVESRITALERDVNRDYRMNLLANQGRIS